METATKGGWVVTRAEFNTAFKALHSRYPGFAMPDPKSVGDIWFQDLKRYSLKTLNRAIPQIEEATPQFFPTCGVVRNICQGIVEIDHIQRPTKWIEPHDHGCGLSGKIEISGIRALLYHASPYEALHVKCTGMMVPRCPACGADVPP